MAHDHGRFVWFECVSQNVDQAQSFYTETLPWRVESMPMGSQTYRLLKTQDAGIGGFTEPMKAGAPSHWLPYLSVADVDGMSQKVAATGGTVLAEPFDVPTVGRMAAMQDPQGGVFCLFRSAQGDPDPAKGPGSFHWNELWASDPKAAVQFYSKLFDYAVDEVEMPLGTYFVFKNGDKMRGGVTKSPAPGIPAFWLPYVEVEDADRTVDRAKKNGAEARQEAMDVSTVGRFAVLQDPVGAMIGVIKPAA